MSGPANPASRTECLALAQQQVGDATEWTAEQWDNQLSEDSLLRGEPPVQYFRPYRAALAYALRPGQVKARTEGPVSEQYVDVAATAARLRELDSEWLAHRILAPATTSADFDGAIIWGNW